MDIKWIKKSAFTVKPEKLAAKIISVTDNVFAKLKNEDLLNLPINKFYWMIN